MPVEDIVKLMDSGTKLVGSIVWPALIAFTLVRFGPALRGFFESLSEISLKGGGVEATAKRQKVEAAAALAVATAVRPGESVAGDAEAKAAGAPQAAVKVVTDVVTPQVLRRTNGAVVLWVDDRPDNNIYERQALEALGIKFLISKSTEDAIDLVSRHRVDAIISDMGRPPDARAGYTLLDSLRAAGNRTPFIIYAGSNAPEHKAEARRHGAVGSTNRASELFEYVVQAVTSGL